MSHPTATDDATGTHPEIDTDRTSEDMTVDDGEPAIPADLTADELYRLLTENPNQQSFTSAELDEYRGTEGDQ